MNTQEFFYKSFYQILSFTVKWGTSLSFGKNTFDNYQGVNNKVLSAAIAVHGVMMSSLATIKICDYLESGLSTDANGIEVANNSSDGYYPLEMISGYLGGVYATKLIFNKFYGGYNHESSSKVSLGLSALAVHILTPPFIDIGSKVFGYLGPKLYEFSIAFVSVSYDHMKIGVGELIPGAIGMTAAGISGVYFAPTTKFNNEDNFVKKIFYGISSLYIVAGSFQIGHLLGEFSINKIKEFFDHDDYLMSVGEKLISTFSNADDFDLKEICLAGEEVKAE